MPEGSFVSVDQNVSEIRRHTDWDDWDLIIPGNLELVRVSLICCSINESGSDRGQTHYPRRSQRAQAGQ